MAAPLSPIKSNTKQVINTDYKTLVTTKFWMRSGVGISLLLLISVKYKIIPSTLIMLSQMSLNFHSQRVYWDSLFQFQDGILKPK